MQALIYTLVGLLSVNSRVEQPAPQMKLKYAFEVVRHGARAPMIDDPNFKNE